MSEQEPMVDCPSCEYHKTRARIWREEAYKHAGHPLPERKWIGLTNEDKVRILANDFGGNRLDCMDAADRILKEKNQ